MLWKDEPVSAANRTSEHALQESDGLGRPSYRCVLVTGASTGIGEACALELDRRGCRVFAGVRRESDADRLRRQASQRLTTLLLDITETGAIAAAAETIREAAGGAGLYGLVNNAGIVVTGPLELLPLEQIRRQLEVNVLGQVAVTQAMLPMLRAARGRIVNMGSISGRVAAPCLGPYAASKFALEAVTDAFRLELRQWGIAVSIVEPGSVETPIWEKAMAFAQDLAETSPPEAVALYSADIEAMRRASEHLARTGMPVRKVVAAVMHALFARRPRTRYPVGPATRFSIGALKFAPDRLRDWFVLRSLGMR
ncbi:MAG: SDR family NAD(P)-dependent oxidoreductase [Pirellulales bacterium]|nr:SDR family NAD(P)-dependent oxidoreductase [Pirellulales bacterium]